jgi:3-hydroxyisobutyrate dehydrogenase-like beta-hydroxyacid dehydrogenase
LRLDLACGPGRLRADRQAHLQLPGARHGGPHRGRLQLSARKAEIDWSKLYDALLRGSTNSAALRRIMEPALQGNFDGYAFSIANAHKDLTYYTALATEGGFRSGLAAETMAAFDKALAAGHGQLRVSRLLDPKLNQD